MPACTHLAQLSTLLLSGPDEPSSITTSCALPSYRRFYGGTPQLKAAYSMRPGAEADDSYGVIEFGSCGFTHSDGVLAYPKDMYAALAGRELCPEHNQKQIKGILCIQQPLVVGSGSCWQLPGQSSYVGPTAVGLSWNEPLSDNRSLGLLKTYNRIKQQATDHWTLVLHVLCRYQLGLPRQLWSLL